MAGKVERRHGRESGKRVRVEELSEEGRDAPREDLRRNCGGWNGEGGRSEVCN